MSHSGRASNPLRRRFRPRWPRPDLWVSWRPNGFGLVKPNHYAEMIRTIRENRGRLGYAARILTRGACDGCALGVAGLHDWTLDGVHLCTTRLNLLRVNTMDPAPVEAFGDIERLRGLTSKELRDLGRLPAPLVRRRGDSGFRPISWDEALDLVAEELRRALPDRVGFFTTSRGITNEVYYVAGKVARLLGTNNIDNAARICHAPSTVALKESLGVAATTVSYTDVIDHAQLVVLLGSNVANAQPVFMKYLYLAKRRGARIVVINPLREPGLERYWVPSNLESALFGTRVADDFFEVATGGDSAFLLGVLTLLHRRGAVDHDFLSRHTTGWDELAKRLDATDPAEMAAMAGTTLTELERFADLYAGASSAVLVWSMGITQHAHGTDNVRAIIALALARGNIGRPGAGLMPIRGHSGVQGGSEMGAYATSFPGGVTIDAAAAADLSERWGFPVPSEPGLTATEMVSAAAAGRMDVLWSSGGNFMETLPDPAAVEDGLQRVRLRVHVDILASSQMLIDGDTVLLLPAMTRYEQPGGGTETTTERRIIFSPEIPGPRPPLARPEWWIYTELASRVAPERAALLGCGSADAIREEIARVIPAYRGIERLARTGDQVQWGGERLCEGGAFPTPDGRARLVPFDVHDPRGGAGLRLTTRRGKQFNSMVWNEVDPLTGAGRDALLIAESDARHLGVATGDLVTVRSPHGAVPARIHVAPLHPGDVQMFFPEANPLLDPERRDPEGLVPDYGALVTVERTGPRP